MTMADLPIGAGLRLSLPKPLLRAGLVLGGFTLLSIVLFWPWLAHLSSALIGPPEDNQQDFWNSWHIAHATRWRDLFFTQSIRFPEGTSLAYHSIAWPQVAAVALLAHIFGGDVATMVALQNLTLLASFPLGAAAMFYLARHLLGEDNTIGAVVAGFVFAFNPWHVAQVMHHAHVSGIEFLPLFVLFYLRALNEGSAHLVAGAAATLALSALSCWYFLFYGFYFMAFHLLYLRIRGGHWPRGWSLGAPLLCLVSTAAILSPWLLPMVKQTAASVYYEGVNIFVADLAALPAFPPTHVLGRFGRGVHAAITGNAWEGSVYLGLVNVALLAWALTRKQTDKRILYYALGGAAFFLVLAMGVTLHIDGRITPLYLPGVVLAKLPFFANVRTPARAMVMVFLFGGLALGYAISLLKDRKIVLTVIAALMLLDFTPAHLESTQATCPSALTAIANDPEPGAVLDLPRGYLVGNAAMMLSACHGKPIVAGETSRQMNQTLLDKLETRDLAAQKRQLTVAGVKYVVLHRAQGESFHWNKSDGVQADYPHVYRGIAADRDVTVLRVY